MNTFFEYKGPASLDAIWFSCNQEGLTSLWFAGQNHLFENSVKGSNMSDNHGVLQVYEIIKLWLDDYFTGNIPDFTPPLSLKGTDFQMAVWKILLDIPYGQVVTYGDIAKKIAAQRGLKRMSAQAVGGAVGRNPISIIVPCHRVIGANGSLTGYAGGISNKIWLLEQEGIDIAQYSIPVKKRTIEQ